jgi:hypothetical protein
MKHLQLQETTLVSTLSAWKREFPEQSVIALLPEAEKDKVSLLQSVCSRLGIPLAGAIFPALVTSNGFCTEGAWLLRLDRGTSCSLVADLTQNSESDGRKLADAVQAMLSTQNHLLKAPLLYLVFDGMVPNISSILDATYDIVGDEVDYAGVNAGSETFQPMPCLFDETRHLGNGVLCMLLSGEAPAMLDHGFSQPESTVCATVTEGNRVATINSRPAFDVYRELIKANFGIELTPENFYQYCVHFPFGILEGKKELAIRIPVVLNPDGSLFFVGEVPTGVHMMLMKAPPLWGDNYIERIAQSIVREGGSITGRQLLVFYCAGRRMHLGTDAQYEIAALSSGLGAESFGGALSLGEIGSTRHDGYPNFHNATLICKTWINA